jgi:rod shape-determining protein MreC
VSSELSSNVNRERTGLVLIPLLVLQIIFLSLQIEGPSGTLLLKSWALAAQAPILAVSSSVSSGIQSVWHDYVWIVGARAENEELKEAVRRLSLLNSAFAEAREENIRLRKLVSLSDDMAFKTIGARVVARTPSFLSNVIYINRGLEDGVRVNAPVISGAGIIGRTIIVSRHQAQVQLITNPDASMGAMLKESRTPGILSGSGNPLLNLNYISNTDEAAVGDIVVSSGLDGIYPKGLVLGKVVDSHKGKGVFRSIKVEPFMDLIHIEEVAVLLNKLESEQ